MKISESLIQPSLKLKPMAAFVKSELTPVNRIRRFRPVSQRYSGSMPLYQSLHKSQNLTFRRTVNTCNRFAKAVRVFSFAVK